MALSASELSSVESALTGPNGDALMSLMRRLTTGGRPSDDYEPAILEQAASLGWINGSHFPTDLGWKMGDPIREFLFWNDRDRTVHEWMKLPVMRPEYFTGKRLLSIGCGCGTNLFTFQTMCSSVVGLEIEEIYLQFVPLWAKLAGVDVPKTVRSGAESTPFPDDDFDVIVCFGALQYMEIRDVLTEASRLLRPGGIFVFTLSNFVGYITELTSRARTFRRPQEVLRESAIFLNMITYPWTGRVITRKHDPVYPTLTRMRRWLNEAELELDDHLTRVYNHEVCYVARAGATSPDHDR